MDINTYLSGITANITNQTAPATIPATVVGQAFTDLANLIQPEIVAVSGYTAQVSGVTTGHTALINVLSASTASLSASTFTAINALSASTFTTINALSANTFTALNTLSANTFTAISSLTGTTGLTVPSSYNVAPSASTYVVNNIANTPDTGAFALSNVFAETDNVVTIAGYVGTFRTKLANAEVGRKVRFYVLRQTSTNQWLVVYDSGDIAAEIAGINTYSPPFATVKVQVGDAIGCLTKYISSANAQCYQASGGNPIGTAINLALPVVQGSTYTGTVQPTSRKFSIDAIIYQGDLLVARYWSNQPNGYPLLDGNGLVSQSQLPNQVGGINQTHTETPVQLWSTAKQSNAIVRKSGGVDTFSNAAGQAAGTLSNTSSFGNVVIIPKLTATPGILNAGILTEVTIGQTSSTASGATVQAWVLRPDSSGNYAYLATIGEIDGSVANRYHTFKGLSIFVQPGDLIAFRSIGMAINYFSGSGTQAPYSYQSYTLTDLTLNAISSGITLASNATSTNSRVFFVEGIVYKNSSAAKNSPGAAVGLDDTGYIPATIGRSADLYWQQKKVIWVGTSIPAGNSTTGGTAVATSYPLQVGTALDANMDNESVGSSGIIWNGTRALTLSATQAELNAAFPGYGTQSYEVKILGKGCQLLVFDHGHNDAVGSSSGATGALPYTSRTGTITTLTGSTGVTGVGTLFTTEVKVGDKLFNSNRVVIGYVQSITSDTALVLTANALIAVSGGGYAFTNLDRTTFYGAFSYIIDKCYAENPSMSIMFVTPPNRYSYTGTVIAVMDAVRSSLIALANAYDFPICDVMSVAGYTPENVSIRTVDGVHPTATERPRIANILYNFIKGVA